MPFEVIPTISGGEKKVRASISYRRMRKGGQNVSPRLTVGIPASAVNGFVPEPGQLFAFYLGTDADAGKGRILPCVTGARARLFKGGATFMFGSVPMLGRDEGDREYVAVRSIPGGFEIDLPDWLNPYHEARPDNDD